MNPVLASKRSERSCGPGRAVPANSPASERRSFRCAESVAPYRVERDAASQYPRETALLRCDALALSVRAALERIVPALARAAAAFVGAGCWRSFGYARAGDHARERFGRSGRWLRDLAALGAAFEKLPGLADAVVGSDTDAGPGRPIGRVAATIIARVAAPESLQAWVETARAVPVRSLREMAAHARLEDSAWPPQLAAVVPAEDDTAQRPVDGRTADAPRGATGVSAADDIAEPMDVVGSSTSLFRQRGGGSVVPAKHTLDSDARRDDTADDDDASRGVLVRLLVPRAVAAAFDEALDLYRALAGSQTTVTEFVEALVADVQAGPGPADAHAEPLGSGHSGDDGLVRALREQALARSTENWKHLSSDAVTSPDWAFALAGMSLAALEDVCSRAGTGGPMELDAQISALIHLEDDLERRLARLLMDMADQNAWSRLRFDSVGHYAEQRLGMSRSAAQDRVRAQRGLAWLPVVNKAYQRGDIGLDAALLIVRIIERGGSMGEERQRAWVQRAREASLKRLRDDERLMRRLRAVGASDGVEVILDADTGGRDAADMLDDIPGAPRESRSHDMPPDDEAWQRSLRREPGTARQRIATFGRAAFERPQGDHFFRLRLPADLAAGFLSCMESARARLARVAEEVPWDQPWPGEAGNPDNTGDHGNYGGPETAAVSASLLCARMFSIRCRRTPAWVGLLAMLEEFARTWDDPQMSPRRASDAIYIRDGWRCTAPGCTSRRNLEDHHIVYRSRGGSDEPSNRTCLCRFHHQLGEHGGLSTCRGMAPLGIHWTLGRNGAGGRWRNEIRTR